MRCLHVDEQERSVQVIPARVHRGARPSQGVSKPKKHAQSSRDFKYRRKHSVAPCGSLDAALRHRTWERSLPPTSTIATT
jgi:hypothetical protein